MPAPDTKAPKRDAVTPMEAKEPHHPSASVRRRECKTQLQIAEGGRNLDTLGAVVRGWVVPLLVKEFLAEYDAARSQSEVNSKNELPDPGQEGAE